MLRARKATDHEVGADGLAGCSLCGERVPVDVTGHCELGHRVTSPEAVAVALHPEPVEVGDELAGPWAAEAEAVTADDSDNRWDEAGDEGPGFLTEPVEPATPGPFGDQDEVGDVADLAAAPLAAAPVSTDEAALRDLLDFEDAGRRSA